VAAALRVEGHDARTVVEEGFRGHSDREIAEVCCQEQRAIITLDVDFADIREYPPENYPGLVVLRVASQARAHVLLVVSQAFELFEQQPLAGHLWIVSESGVRIRPGKPSGEKP